MSFGISAEVLADMLQYTKRSRNVHTYVSGLALENIRYGVITVHKEDIEGDLIDCGVFRGGTAIYMAGVLQYLFSSRCVFVVRFF